MSTFSFGNRSERELREVHPDLVAVHREALTITEVDYGIFDGIRTKDEQRELVNIGASFTMNSRHLATQGPDEEAPTAKATDCVPVVGGKYRWEWGPIYRMTSAIWYAANKLECPLVWGGAWDRPFLDLNPADLETEVLRYIKSRQKLGRRVFLDGPHFELPRETHP